MRRVFSHWVSARWPALLLALFVWSGVLASAWAQGATVTTLAGTAGVVGSVDGVGAAASFSGPCGVAVDAAGNVYVADTDNNAVRKITPAGEVSTLAGAAAGLCLPGGVACDAAGNVYVADTWNQVIRKITPAGLVSILAGAVGVQGGDDGSGAVASFCYPGGVACDAAGNVYVADTLNNAIRKVTPAGEVSTLVGADAGLDSPGGVACDAAGNVYVADTYDQVIRKITSAGLANVLAGAAGEPGSADGAGAVARFYYPGGVACDAAGTIYVADTSNNTIRRATVDAAPPVTTATPPLASSATGGWRNSAQTVTLAATDAGSGVASTSYSIDGGPTLTYGDPFTVSTPGSHAVTYFSTDNAGNAEQPRTGYVNIDTTVPTTKAQPAGVRAGKTVTLKFRVADAAISCGKATVKIEIKKGSRVVKTVSVGTKATNVALTYGYKTALGKGTYTWRVLATDAAGNKAVDTLAAKLTVK